MADNPFGDLLADLTASSDATEKAEREAYTGDTEPSKQDSKAGELRVEGEQLLDVEPVAEPKKTTALEENKPSDELFPSPVEFPDLSLEGEKSEYDFEDEAEETESEDEVPESEDEVPEQAGSFDIEGTLAEIDKLKVSDLRKAYLRVKAEKIAVENEQKEARTAAKEAADKLEQYKQEQLDSATEPQRLSYEEYKPYQDLSKEYESWKVRAIRKVKSGAVRTKLATPGMEKNLREMAAAIELLPAEQYDAARNDFEKQVAHQFGSEHAASVLSLADEAAEFEMRGQSLRKEFDDLQDEKIYDFAQARYEEKLSDLNSKLTGIFNVKPQEVQANPYSVRAIAAGIMKDSKHGAKLTELAKGDIESIQNILSGAAPFKPDASLNAADVAEQKKLYLENKQKVEAMSEQLPEVLAQGLMALRLLPMLAKDLATTTKGKTRKTPIPSSKPTPKKKAKTEAEMTPEEAQKALDASFAKMGI